VASSKFIYFRFTSKKEKTKIKKKKKTKKKKKQKKKKKKKFQHVFSFLHSGSNIVLQNKQSRALYSSPECAGKYLAFEYLHM